LVEPFGNAGGDPLDRFRHGAVHDIGQRGQPVMMRRSRQAALLPSTISGATFSSQRFVKRLRDA
jgi:hypothetical protein